MTSAGLSWPNTQTIGETGSKIKETPGQMIQADGRRGLVAHAEWAPAIHLRARHGSSMISCSRKVNEQVAQANQHLECAIQQSDEKGQSWVTPTVQ
jgi:hypothetical protein